MKPIKINKNKLKNILYTIFVGKSVARKISMFYLYAIIFGIIALSMPFALKQQGTAVLIDDTTRTYNFIDSFFTSITAFSNTGLLTLNLSATYNIFGQIIILLLIQFGGLGLFTLYWIFWNFIFNNIFVRRKKALNGQVVKKSSFSNTLLIASERGNTKLGLSMRSVKTAVIFILITEIIFATIYAIMFYSIPSYEQQDVANSIESWNHVLPLGQWFIDDTTKLAEVYQNPGLAIWTGIFQSVSTMNQAGLDIVSSTSYSAFRNGVWTIFLWISMIQIIIGGIGYPVIYDVIEFVRHKYRKQKFHFSLFTKVSTITYFLIMAFGIIFVFSFEYGLDSHTLIKTYQENAVSGGSDALINYFGTDPNLVGWNQFTTLMFNVVSSRSSGASTISQTSLSYGSFWITIILMFLGCAPSSTGGGIRTITIAILFMATLSKIRGTKQITAFKRAIPDKNAIEASIIIFIAFVVIIMFSFISYPLLFNIDPTAKANVSIIIFEFSSAFGTVGLSSGLSGFLNGATINSYIIAILLGISMIIGQLGVSTTLLSFRTKTKLIGYANEELRL